MGRAFAALRRSSCFLRRASPFLGNRTGTQTDCLHTDVTSAAGQVRQAPGIGDQGTDLCPHIGPVLPPRTILSGRTGVGTAVGCIWHVSYTVAVWLFFDVHVWFLIDSTPLAAWFLRVYFGPGLDTASFSTVAVYFTLLTTAFDALARS